MKISSRKQRASKPQHEKEQNELLSFLSRVPGAVNRFNENFGFGIECLNEPVTEIDGDREIVRKAGFVLVRKNTLMSGREYCLYAIFKDGTFSGYIGLNNDSVVTTVKELKPMKGFQKAEQVLLEWMTQLVRASFEKITL